MSYTNAEGLMMQSGQQLGNSWNQTDYGYDSFNRLTSTVSPGGSLTQTEYDGQGRALLTYCVFRINRHLVSALTGR